MISFHVQYLFFNELSLTTSQAKINKRKMASLNYTEDDNLVSGDEYKMLLVVRMDLKMGKGWSFIFFLRSHCQ